MHSKQPELMPEQASYSQWGEDILVFQFFGNRLDGVFFEAGAHHPTAISQTYLLELKGWSGVLVEALADNKPEFIRLRPRSKLVEKALGGPEHRGQLLDFSIPPDGNTAKASLSICSDYQQRPELTQKVEVTTITDVLDAAGIKRLDYLSLDIEGNELAAFKGLDFKRWQPRLILVEDHLYNLKLHRFLQSKHYRLVYRTGSNNWYVPSDTLFPMLTLKVKIELFRKLYLSMPFRKLRIIGKKLRGLPP